MSELRVSPDTSGWGVPGVLPLSATDPSGATIYGTPPGWQPGQPLPQPVDPTTGASTMPINVDPKLYGPGTAGAIANARYGGANPTPDDPQHMHGYRTPAQIGLVPGQYPPSESVVTDPQHMHGYRTPVPDPRYPQPAPASGGGPGFPGFQYTPGGPPPNSPAAMASGDPDPATVTDTSHPRTDPLDVAYNHIKKAEGGGLYTQSGGHTYDPTTTPTKPGYYGFPDLPPSAYTAAGPSHSTGELQFQPDTWKAAVEYYKSLTGPGTPDPDFRNEADQRRVGKIWAAKRYADLTGGRSLIADIKNGTANWSALGPEWQAFAKGDHTGAPGTDMLAGASPAVRGYIDAAHREIADLKPLLDALTKQIAGMNADDPELRKVLQRRQEVMDRIEQRYLDIAMNPPQRTHRDMMTSFGSIPMLMAVIGGSFARVPAIASLNAAGAAMEAMNAGDERDYRDKIEIWKSQTVALGKAFDMENSSYRNILDDKNTTFAHKIEAMREAFSLYGNVKGLRDIELGNFEVLMKDQETRDKLMADLPLKQAQTEEAMARAAKLRGEAEWGMPGVTGEAGMLIRNQLTRMAQERNPNAKPEEIPGLARELAKDPKTLNDAVQQAYAIQHPEAGGLQTQLLNQLDRERQAEGKPPMTAQEKWDLLQAEKPLSPSQIHDQERTSKVVATLDLANDTIAMIQHSVAVVGLSGRLRGPLETIGNILGATDETTRRQIESNIRQLQQEFAEETSGRNIYTRQQAEFQDQIIRGLSSGSTVQNTIKTIQNMQDHVVQIYKPQLERWGYLKSDNPPPGLRRAEETQWPADPAKAGLKEGDTATDPQSGVTRTVKGGKWDPPL